MKKIIAVYSAPEPHWVGNAFFVRSLFSYNSHGQQLSPFLLLDYASAKDFAPIDTPRGVGSHPHRGFETVTIVYQGEVAHRDSTGKGGVIGPGDVQWMTAGAGILHEELHSPSFSQSGGKLEMVQLWVNLPANHKMTTPGYQPILSRDIPTVSLPNQAGSVRVIAGEFEGHKGPAHTFTPLNVWDAKLKQGSTHTFTLPEGWTAALVILKGTVKVNEDQNAHESQVVVLERAGNNFSIEANTDASVLILSGEPIEEPIVGYGPFVMNNRQEIAQAIEDFNSGRFGLISR